MENMTTDTLHTCSYECDRPECVRAQRDYLRDRLEALTAVQRSDAGLDVEAVLRRFLTGDGYIAECDIHHIVAALTAQPTISGYTCTVPDDCETLRWRGQILSMNELASVAQPAAVDDATVARLTKDQRTRLVEKLVSDQVEGADRLSSYLWDVLKNGFRGYSNYTDQELLDAHWGAFDEDFFGLEYRYEEEKSE